MTRLLVLRHGESEWNALGRWQGWADPPLSDAGRDQARAAARALAGLRAAVVSSDLRRCMETAEIMALTLGLEPPSPEPGLREVDVGEWSGLTRDEIEQRWPGLLAAWRSRELRRAPGGEDRDAFQARVVAALERVAARHHDHDVLVLAHSGVIHAVERHVGETAGLVPNLGGRWFEAASPLRAAGSRVELL